MTTRLEDMGQTPAALASERAVLGIILATRGDVIPEVDEATGGGQAMYGELHRDLYRVMREYWREHDAVDAESLITHLMDTPSTRGGKTRLDDFWTIHPDHQGMLGISELHNLASPASWRGDRAQLHRALDAIGEAASKRALLTGTMQIHLRISRGAMDALSAVDELGQLAQRVTTRQEADPSDPTEVARRMKESIIAQLEGRAASGVTCGVGPIDALYQAAPGTNTVVAGYSKMGKTTLAMAMAGGYAREHDAIVLYYPCEGYERLLVTRLLCAAWAGFEGYTHANANGDLLPTLREDWIMRFDRMTDSPLKGKVLEDYSSVLGWLSRSGVYVKPVGTTDVRRVEADLAATRARHPDRLICVVVDYVQHFHCGDLGQDERHRIADASRRLTTAYGKYKAIGITLSQYTDQGAQDDPVKLPNPTQMRGAKDVRNDASAILTVHRPYFRSSALEQRYCVIDLLAREGVPSHVVADFDGGTKQYTWWTDGVLDAPGVQSPRMTPPASAGGWSERKRR